jgi:hypothetical protein
MPVPIPAAPAQAEAILPIIQLAITPVILISGIGALVISMTNRMGRIVDRTRNLAGLMRQASGPDRNYTEQQLHIMFRRAKMMRFSLTMATTSMFFSGLLIVVIFVSALFERTLAWVILALFGTSVAMLLASLAAFISDIWVSLSALGVEVKRALDSPKH